ncbi:MAG: YicC family protein [Rhizobiales bacterium]|nr:YicC family protein [Hyphomicrobiales bacterium]
MPAKSMTGFARHEGALGSDQWYWELRSVNGRGLDIRMRLAPGHDQLEPFVREAVRGKFSRGSIQISLNVKSVRTESQIQINEQALSNLLESSKKVADKFGLEAPGLEALLNVRGVVETIDPEESEDELNARIDALKLGFSQALDDLASAREEEGDRLVTIIAGQLQRISELTSEAAAAPSRSPENIRARILQQIERVTDVASEMDPDRLHQEAVIIAAKADIQEEIDRLKAHVEAGRDLLSSNGPAGRKLDFLTQEFNRESNTLCSKSNHVDLTSIGLELKVVIDQMREQVQNIE